MKTTSNIRFTGILIQDPQDKGFTAYLAEMPEVIAEGDTAEEANSNLMISMGIIMDVKRDDTESNLNSSNYNVTHSDFNFEMV